MTTYDDGYGYGYGVVRSTATIEFNDIKTFGEILNYMETKAVESRFTFPSGGGEWYRGLMNGIRHGLDYLYGINDDDEDAKLEKVYFCVLGHGRNSTMYATYYMTEEEAQERCDTFNVGRDDYDEEWRWRVVTFINEESLI